MPKRFSTYEEFTKHLQDREYFGQKLGLERIQKILSRLGNPQEEFSSIHIAGTNGKGSTAAMLASVLREEGLRVGLYTSPHLIDFCERIQVVGARLIAPLHIPQQKVLNLLQKIQEVEEEPLTFFEMATVMAFLWFAEKKVDCAVVEVGLGGRLDATNVLKPLVSVITTIGLDHTIHLGDTLEKIAYEKAGIIKPDIPVVVGDLPDEAMRVVERVAVSRESRVITVGASASGGSRPNLPHIGGRGILPLQGKHQIHNAQVAIAVIHQLPFQISPSSIQSGLAHVAWPGRLETLQEKPWILLDGAHNTQAMKVVADYLRENLKGRRLKILMGAMADKDLRGLLAEIAPIADGFIFTSPQLKRAASPESLAALADELGKKSTIASSVKEGFEFAQKQLRDDEVLLVTGSLFVVGEVKREIQ